MTGIILVLSDVGGMWSYLRDIFGGLWWKEEREGSLGWLYFLILRKMHREVVASRKGSLNYWFIVGYQTCVTLSVVMQ